MYPNLKLQLWKLGLRQNRLAQILGLDETMVSRIVNGFRAPTPVLRSRIAQLLESDEAWLFERAGGPGSEGARSAAARRAGVRSIQ